MKMMILIPMSPFNTFPNQYCQINKINSYFTKMANYNIINNNINTKNKIMN